MANNQTAKDASGSTVIYATDDVSTVNYPVVKLAAGVEDDATRIGHLEDAAHASGDAGIMALAVRKAAAADLSAGNTDGDYEPLQVDALGKLWIVASYLEDAAHTDADKGLFVLSRRIDAAASSAGTSGDYASLNTDASGKLWISGAFAEDVAHTDADVGLAMLTKRTSAAATSAGTDGDYATLNSDDAGKLWVNGGDVAYSSAAFTRPNDTTAYAVGDAVNNSTSAPTIMTFTGCARANGGGGYVVGAMLFKNTATVASGNFRLHLYHTTATMYNDNAALTVLYADATKYVGAIDFSIATDGVNISDAQDFSLRIPYKCDASDTQLYGMIQAKGAYTPGLQDQFTVLLMLDRT